MPIKAEQSIEMTQEDTRRLLTQIVSTHPTRGVRNFQHSVHGGEALEQLAQHLNSLVRANYNQTVRENRWQDPTRSAHGHEPNPELTHV